jgi:hypothetical protein
MSKWALFPHAGALWGYLPGLEIREISAKPASFQALLTGGEALGYSGSRLL